VAIRPPVIQQCHLCVFGAQKELPFSGHASHGARTCCQAYSRGMDCPRHNSASQERSRAGLPTAISKSLRDVRQGSSPSGHSFSGRSASSAQRPPRTGRHVLPHVQVSARLRRATLRSLAPPSKCRRWAGRLSTLLETYASCRGAVQLDVLDQRLQMSGSVLIRVLEPFCTTKGPPGSISLDLAPSYRLLQRLPSALIRLARTATACQRLVATLVG
jgi:hypothetical protein